MGGTDLMDENVNRYRVSIWSKKWWWAIFTCCLHVAVQNAWVLYKREVNAGMTQLQFRREIVSQDMLDNLDLPAQPWTRDLIELTI
ncbi:hypothetical protein M8J76_001890 [Diaphorina citri]|nr:hypothetical protein M8J75_013279 [Diaphorina citri]KAI5732581.1 hypothetical protein M8J76_001890 [Diaphorina citri]